jgi:drug/metabolite transporter (DMT)-like permease
MPTKILILAVTINAVIGQLLLKRALVAMGGKAALASIPKFILAAAVSPWVYASLAVQALGYVLWMLLISREKIGVAIASVAAGFYGLMAFSAWALYGETLTPLQWFGLGFVSLGVACIGLGTV